MIRPVLLACALALAAPAAAQDQPGLEDVAIDGIRMCMSIAEGRTPAEAAVIFGFTAAETGFQRETDRGEIAIVPPTDTRRSCRVQISALVLEETDVLDAVTALVTAPPYRFAQLQSRIAERIGDYAARVTIWASSDGAALGMLTIYEILANDYYLGPKMMIDYVVDRR